jgi:16S rRNA (cytidine1402-2'-O)-methyltransferase
MSSGASVALVTDAGTPSVSDPGTELVRAAVAAGVDVVPIPGVSAVTAAVAASGLVDGPFLFLGFPPAKGAGRREFLARAMKSAEPVVLFEAPHRIERTLSELAAEIPEREAVLCRELTKVYEELRRGTLSELARSDANFRGEITLVIARATPSEIRPVPAPDVVDQSIVAELARGGSPRSVVDVLGEIPGFSRRDLYRRVMELAGRSGSGPDEDP